jgi:3-methyladenine DNA glycosylase Mpg
MRNVFSNSELAHTYANQTQNSGRSSSMFFEGRTIYSYGYHFPICSITTNEKGETALLFTTRGYSNTTGKHITIVRSATKQYKKIYCNNPKGTHEENFKAWLNSSEQIAKGLINARKPEKYLTEIAYNKGQAEQYSEFFGIGIPQNLQDVFNISNKQEYLKLYEKQIEFEKQEAKRRLREQKIQFKEQFKKWLNEETDRLYTNYKYDFLRIKDDRVETTQAVKIPLELAKRLYLSIKNGSLSVGDKILNYSIDKVGQEIKIGCHTFTKPYLLRFGSQLF